jgi:hypothetical protein
MRSNLLLVELNFRIVLLWDRIDMNHSGNVGFQALTTVHMENCILWHITWTIPQKRVQCLGGKYFLSLRGQIFDTA